MYTRLPHNAIKTKVSEALQEAFSFKNILRLESSDPTRFPSLALAECQKLLEFCIDSSFIALRGYIWRQTIGIPMGGNASSDIANLYCYRVESAYIDSLIEAKNLDLARQHDHSLHQTSGEGLLGGECGWAALNFIADHLYIDRINFSFLQNYQQRFYEESLKEEPNNSEHKPSPDGWFSLQVLNMACMTKFNKNRVLR